MLIINLHIKWYVANKYLTIDLCFIYLLTYINVYCRSSCGTSLVRGLELWYFNANVTNSSVISWRSVLLVEETVVRREIHWPATS